MTSPRTLDRSFQIPASTVTSTLAIVAAPQAAPLRRNYRERDFGVGYGNSSGYAGDQRYASAWGQPQFRCW